MPRSELSLRTNVLAWLLMYNCLTLPAVRHVVEAKALDGFWGRYLREAVGLPVILLGVSAMFVFLQTRRPLSPQQVAEAEKSRQLRHSMGWRAIVLMLFKINAAGLGGWGVLAYWEKSATSPLHLEHYILVVLLASVYVTLAQLGTLWRFDRVVSNSPHRITAL